MCKSEEVSVSPAPGRECQQQIFKSLRVFFTRLSRARSRQSTQFIVGNRGLQTADLTGTGNWMNRVWPPRAIALTHRTGPSNPL
jgi:hypothetical protein